MRSKRPKDNVFLNLVPRVLSSLTATPPERERVAVNGNTTLGTRLRVSVFLSQFALR